ncbi:MAG: hypothetical protein RLZZ488_539 [Pseudomonadota bacterium]|jgi:hypothetical protein
MKPLRTSFFLMLSMSISMEISAAEGARETRLDASTTSATQKFSQPFAKGVIAVESAWMTVQQTASEIDVLFGRVSFQPNELLKADSCGDVSFIQIAKILDNSGNDYQWPAGQNTRNILRTKNSSSEGVNAGWFVDHDDLRCKTSAQTCSPYFRDSWPNEEEGSRDGKFMNGSYSDAVLVDFPFGWEVISSAALEACAVCRKSEELLGCVSWGGTWPTTGDRTLHKNTAGMRESPTFTSALHLFNKYYKTKFKPR